MRYFLIFLFGPILAGCAMDDQYQAPPPPAYAVPNACAGNYRAGSPMVAVPQTQEPPR